MAFCQKISAKAHWSLLSACNKFTRSELVIILINLSPSNLLASTPNPTHLLASSNQDIDPAYSEADHTPTETDYYYTVEEEASPQPESDLTGYEETINQVTHTHR